MDASRKALEVIAEVAERQVDDLARTHHLMADLGIDSPKGLRLIMDLEDAFGFEISDDDAEGLETVGSILDYVERQTNVE